MKFKKYLFLLVLILGFATQNNLWGQTKIEKPDSAQSDTVLLSEKQESDPRLTNAPMEEEPSAEPLLSNNAVVFGLLMGVLALVFYTSHHPSPILKQIYKFVPALLLCYFVPAILNSVGVIDGENVQRLVFRGFPLSIADQFGTPDLKH